MGIFLFIGLAILSGFLGGKLSHKVKFPSVVGYLIAGLFLGPSFLNFLHPQILDKLVIFGDLALSIIAFIIGSELNFSNLKKLGKSITTIIFSESFFAFFLVTIGVYLLTRKLYLALVLGAIAPASAPAGTAVVLQEYKAKGPLTRALYAVVGFDDGLGIIIFAFASAIAKLIMGGNSKGIIEKAIGGPILEITGSLILGVIFGFLLGFSVRNLRRKGDILTLSLATIFILTGISKSFHFSLILSNLTLGMIFANFFLFANRRVQEVLNSIAPPIYIIFFVIAGAHLNIKLLPAMGLLGLVYVICRTLGLVGGASFGATVTGAPSVIRKYLGWGILSQAGVAIGLAVLVVMEFSPLGSEGKALALTVINTVTATTILFEILGPIGVKYAITKAGETKIS
ncbi:MAG: hypothetical protein DRP76_03045 [Candidatus Omnitrophota bacterium]|nr:MAG: hypothetical protein DRP76_03045 [Candidatus Omnitrophota bacterium]